MEENDQRPVYFKKQVYFVSWEKDSQYLRVVQITIRVLSRMTRNTIRLISIHGGPALSSMCCTAKKDSNTDV